LTGLKNERGEDLDSDLLARLVDGFFPKGSCPSVAGNRDPLAQSFFVIPGKQGPRWVLPENPAHGWPALRSWRPYNFASQGKWAVLMAAYRAGLLGLVPGIVKISIAIPAAANWLHLGWGAVAAPRPVIHVGTPSCGQRFVASLVDPCQGRALAIAKVPVGADAPARILREADLLERLAEEKPGLGPRLLFRDSDRGIATEEVLCGRRTDRRWTAAHRIFLEKLRIPGETISLQGALERLRPGLGGLLREKADGIGRILDGLEDPTPLPAVWVHGDFAPWNLFLRDGSLVACDWEYARPSGLPLFDAMHFMWMQRYLFSDRKSDVPVEDLLAAFSIDAKYGDQISKFYRCAMMAFVGLFEEYQAFLYSSLTSE